MYVTSDFIGCTCFINQKVGMGIIFKNSLKVSKVQPIISCCLGLRGSEINIKENLVLILLHLKNSECFLNQSWSSKMHILSIHTSIFDLHVQIHLPLQRPFRWLEMIEFLLTPIIQSSYVHHDHESHLSNKENRINTCNWKSPSWKISLLYKSFSFAVIIGICQQI